MRVLLKGYVPTHRKPEGWPRTHFNLQEPHGATLWVYSRELRYRGGNTTHPKTEDDGGTDVTVAIRGTDEVNNNIEPRPAAHHANPNYIK